MLVSNSNHPTNVALVLVCHKLGKKSQLNMPCAVKNTKQKFHFDCMNVRAWVRRSVSYIFGLHIVLDMLHCVLRARLGSAVEFLIGVADFRNFSDQRVKLDYITSWDIC